MPSTIIPDTKTIKFNSLLIGAVITVAVLGIVLIVDKTNNLSIELHNYIDLFTCGAVTTGLVYTAISLQYNYISHNERLEFDRQNNERKEKREDDIIKSKKMQLTFKISSLWFKGDMAENVERARRILKPYKQKHLNNHTNFEEFIIYLDNNESDRKSLVAILNFFENISSYLEKNIVDEECMQDVFKALFCSYYSVLKPYIDNIQTDSPRYFKSYVNVVKRWQL